MKTYKVTVEYRGKVTVEVDAETEERAQLAGMMDADEIIHANLSVYDINVKEKQP